MQDLFDILIPLWYRLTSRRLWGDEDKSEHDQDNQGEQDERATTAAILLFNTLMFHDEILSAQPGTTVIQ